jgi:hypothetical protein
MVLALFLIFVLLFAALAVVSWAWTLFFQGYMYSEPVTQLYWRAPVAGVVLTLFIAFWCFLDYKNPGGYSAFPDFVVPREEEQFDKFWAVKKKQEYRYNLTRDAKNRIEYDNDLGKPWSRSDTEGVTEAIIVQDKDGNKLRFEAELTPDGKFKAKTGEPVRYVEADGRGRVMTDQYIGKVSTVRKGLLVVNILLNILHLVVWFICLWLILRFQWSHAFGFALVLWLVMSFIIVPVFGRTEKVSKERNAAQKVARLETE